MERRSGKLLLSRDIQAYLADDALLFSVVLLYHLELRSFTQTISPKDKTSSSVWQERAPGHLPGIRRAHGGVRLDR